MCHLCESNSLPGTLHFPVLSLLNYVLSASKFLQQTELWMRCRSAGPVLAGMTGSKNTLENSNAKKKGQECEKEEMNAERQMIKSARSQPNSPSNPKCAMNKACDILHKYPKECCLPPAVGLLSVPPLVADADSWQNHSTGDSVRYYSWNAALRKSCVEILKAQ